MGFGSFIDLNTLITQYLKQYALSIVLPPRTNYKGIKQIHSLTSSKIKKVTPEALKSKTIFPLTPLNNLPGLVAQFLDRKVSFLLDSGCDYNLINGTFLDAILSRNQISLPTFRHSVRLNAHNNTKLSLRKDGILLPLTFSSSSGPQFMSLPFLVESNGSSDTVNIIGFTFMVRKRMVLDLSQLKLYISSTPESHPSDTGDDLSIDSSFSLSVIPFKNIVDPKDSNPGKSSYLCRIPLLPNFTGPLLLFPWACYLCHRIHAAEAGCLSPANLLPWDCRSDKLISWSPYHDIPTSLWCTKGLIKFKSRMDLPLNLPVLSCKIEGRGRQTQPVWFPHLPSAVEHARKPHEPFFRYHSRSFDLHGLVADLFELELPVLEDYFQADVPWNPQSPDAELYQLSDDSILDPDKFTPESSALSESHEKVEPLSLDELPFPFDNEPPFCLENNTLTIHQCRASNADPNDTPESLPEALPTAQNPIDPADNQYQGLEEKSPFCVKLIYIIGKYCALCPQSPCSCANSYEPRDPISRPTSFFYPEFDSSNLAHLFVIHTPSTLPTPNLEPLLHPLMNEAKHHNVINIFIGNTDLLNSEGPMLYNMLSFLVFNGKWHSDKNISIYPATKSSDPSSLIPDSYFIKNPELDTETIGLPSDLAQPVGIEFRSHATGFEADFQQLLKNSDKLLEAYLRCLFETYPDAVSKGPTDIGHLKSPEFLFDLKLRPGVDLELPRQKPYATAMNYRKACTRIVQIWCQSGIAERSKIRTHASRLICVKKQVSTSDASRISERLFRDENLTVEHPQPKNVFLVNVDLLTDSEVSKLYRIALDSVELTKKLAEQVVIQQSTESSLMDLSIKLGEKGDKRLPPDHNFFQDYADVPEELKTKPDALTRLNRLIDAEIDDEKIHSSYLDIRAAHNVLKTTPRASYLLNFLTPTYEFYRFTSGSFGLSNIGSCFNSVLIIILSDLLQLSVVVVYSDDILIITRGLRTHLKIVAEVMRRFARHGLKLSINKCAINCDTIIRLGFKFEPEGIFLTESRIDSISNFNCPTGP